MTIAAIIASLDTPRTPLYTDAQCKAFGIDRKSLKQINCDDSKFHVRLAISLTNNIPFEEVRTMSCGFLGLMERPQPSSYAMSLLIKILTRDDAEGKTKPALDGRFDIGVALHHLQDHALVHKWKSRTFRTCLRSFKFCSQIVAAQRIRTRREEKWMNGCAASSEEKRKAQEVFAASTLAALTIKVPLRGHSDQIWINFVAELAQLAGEAMLKKIGVHSDNFDDMLQKNMHCQVDCTCLTPLMRAYLQICDIVYVDAASHYNVSNALGRMIMYDVFLLTYDRIQAKSDSQVFTMLCENIDTIRCVFDDAAGDKHPRRILAEMSDSTQISDTIAQEIMRAEEEESKRTLHKRQKRRDKKRRHRQNRSDLNEEKIQSLDDCAANDEGHQGDDDENTPSGLQSGGRDASSPRVATDDEDASGHDGTSVSVRTVRSQDFDETRHEDGANGESGHDGAYEWDISSTCASAADLPSIEDLIDYEHFIASTRTVNDIDRIMCEQTLSDLFDHDTPMPVAVDSNLKLGLPMLNCK